MMQHLRCSLVGEMGVGKTALLDRLKNRRFTPSSHAPTVGVDFGTASFGDTKVDIWDTAGNPVFSSITEAFYIGMAIVFLVLDVNNLTTTERQVAITRARMDDGSFLVVLINKSDSPDTAFVIVSGADLVCQVSAMNGIGVREAIAAAVSSVTGIPEVSEVSKPQLENNCIIM
jgi:small GTP-binding protein